MKKVGIIGGSGFIGSYITKLFLENRYEVKVSVTDISKEEKFQHLRKLKNSNRLEIKELDVTNKVLLKSFIKDCDIVIHGGTPFQLDVKDSKTELFDPTIKGTENFLEVIKQSNTIKKVVIIASAAAYNTNFPLPAGGKTVNDTFSETDKPFFNEEGHPYAQAKYIANQVVEKFIKDNPNLTFEITSVSPVGVMGNSLSNRQDSTSTGIQFLFKNKIAPNPFIQMLYDLDVLWALVDVEDVAKAIYKAATISGLHGKNYLLSSESYPVSDISLMLNDKVPKNQPKTVYQNAKAIGELGIAFQPAVMFLKAYNY
ncbi:MAG: NAD-dependent epimerase/dehydratase family protein [Lutibacter sp.]|nr:NAD-dependent epimerase/dehydratase family protein [Lutibacter sp.]